MGNTGSQYHGHAEVAAIRHNPHPQAHWQHSLPTDPVLKASHLKVLPDLDKSAKLRSTNNGVILQSGGTISGRRPLSLALPHDRDLIHSNHNAVYRSKSNSKENYDGERPQRFSYLSNQRDPLHRSHTHLHLDLPEESFASQSKRFGSEPDLRNSDELQAKPSKMINKNMKKKYKAPPPPQIQNGGNSSLDSWNAPQRYNQYGHHQGAPQPPSRKLRLFKTRAETKKTNMNRHNHDLRTDDFKHPVEEQRRKSHDMENVGHFQREYYSQTSYERETLLRSPSRERDEFLKYPSSREEDMMQTQSSLKREENILQSAFTRQEIIRSRQQSHQNMYREKAKVQKSKENEDRFDSNREFRSSERFKKPHIDPQVLRREKSFDNSLIQEANAVNRMHNERKSLLDNRDRYSKREESPIEITQREKRNEPQINRKSTVGMAPNMTPAAFQAELMMATKKLRNVSKQNHETKTTDNVKTVEEKREKSIPRVISKTTMANNNSKPIRSSNLPKSNGAINSNNKSNTTTLDRTKPDPKRKESQSTTDVSEDIDKKIKAVPAKIIPTKNVNDDNKHDSNIRNRRESRILTDRGQASGKESTPEQSPSRTKTDTVWDKNQTSQPKAFYFGMDSDTLPQEIPDEEMDPHEKVRRHLEQNYSNFKKAPAPYAIDDDLPLPNLTKYPNYNKKIDMLHASSESALSSEPEVIDLEENNPHGIALQLRPTLPKKQLEIPRFNPAAAWRQLSSDAEAFQITAQEIDRQKLLDKNMIRKPIKIVHDRSGDSGISGDAGPSNDDGADTAPASPMTRDIETVHNRPLISTWTPQQDLEEESSSDAGVDSPNSANTDSVPAPAKFSARHQVFSLSLPRETHLAHIEKVKQSQQGFNSLQKFRKQVSGALGAALSTLKPEDLEENTDEQPNNNWFLSRSAPNSLNNNQLSVPNGSITKSSGAKSNDSGHQNTPPSSDQEDDRALRPVVPGMMRQQPPFSYLASGGHVMYLPQYDSQRSNLQQPFSMPIDKLEQKSDTEADHKDDEKFDYKSATRMMMSRSKSSGELIPPSRIATSKPRTKTKRFTFQSTVRQIERKRLAEKLSKEAETKEMQRLSELEAMRRVEEEFQRKRAREKASIRQQLRLVSLDESCSSLQSSWGQGHGRAEPEGAVSPSPPPVSNSHSNSNSSSGRSGGSGSGASKRAPATRVLSEYRQETREYRDYRRPHHHHQQHHPHPTACYNMPRTTAHVTAAPTARSSVWVSEAVDADNYRREFARGRRPPSTSSSEFSHNSRLLTPTRSGENFLKNEVHNDEIFLTT